MEKIELLEKLVSVQQQHIELMQDYNNLKNSYKDLEFLKNVKIKQLNEEIEGQSEEIGVQATKIEALEVENAELKKQIEILQQSIISVETPEENQ